MGRTVKYQTPKLYRIGRDEVGSGGCANGAATGMSPRCVAGPEATGAGGCAQGAAAVMRCQAGAVAGAECASGMGFSDEVA